jgi:hypothetical protein
VDTDYPDTIVYTLHSAISIVDRGGAIETNVGVGTYSPAIKLRPCQIEDCSELLTLRAFGSPFGESKNAVQDKPAPIDHQREPLAQHALQVPTTFICDLGKSPFQPKHRANEWSWRLYSTVIISLLRCCKDPTG